MIQKWFGNPKAISCCWWSSGSPLMRNSKTRITCLPVQSGLNCELRIAFWTGMSRTDCALSLLRLGRAESCCTLPSGPVFTVTVRVPARPACRASSGYAGNWSISTHAAFGLSFACPDVGSLNGLCCPQTGSSNKVRPNGMTTILVSISRVYSSDNQIRG